MVRGATQWTVALAAVAVAKALIGLATTIAAAVARVPLPGAKLPIIVAAVVMFLGSGLLLLWGGRTDSRARTLGLLFLLVASVFADPLLSLDGGDGSALRSACRAVMALQVDAFMPYLLWRFVREFPRVVEAGAVERRIALAMRVSLVIGVILFAGNGLLFAASSIHAPTSVVRALGYLGRMGSTGLYWPLQFGLCLVAIPTLLWKARRARGEERRRANLLATGLVLGIAPTVTWVFLDILSPAVHQLLPLRRAGWVIYPTLLSTPLSTAYAVLVRRALDVSLVVRRTLQYALARYSVIALAAVPVVLLLASIYAHRHESVAEVVSTPGRLLLTAMAGLGVLTLAGRNQVLSRIDRRFFREQYDTRRILAQLVDHCRVAGDQRGLAEVLRTEIDRALHLDTIRVLFQEDEGVFVSPRDDVRPLYMSPELADLLAASAGPLDVDVEHRGPGAVLVPEHDLYWIIDGGFRLLLPLRDRQRQVMGVVALGEKRSELPFSREDEALLASVGLAAEMAIAYRDLRPSPAPHAAWSTMAAVEEQTATECVQCGAVQPAGRFACARCDAAVTDCALPQVVGGKFLVDERIGSGGMGIVYRGMDVHLGRLVAIKTLPRMSPQEALRLRREARVMASVSHPNLALIFGAETWRGLPVLIVEYLAGGTLADRLGRGRLPVADVLDLGLSLSSVLAAIHGAGILHRDLKPSNVGYTAEGTPKLLDFGLARLLTAASFGQPEEGHPAILRATMESMSSRHPSESALQGTPLYMSPEALVGEVADPSFDLWSLCLVLYEAVAGRHPLVETGAWRAVVAERRTPMPDLRELAPDAPAGLAQLFRRAFSLRKGERPQTAAELRDALQGLRRQLDPSPPVAAPPQSAPDARSFVT